MTDKIPFRPAQLKEQELPNSINNGTLYFTTDTKKIFLDINNSRSLMGGAGSSVFLSDDTEIQTLSDEFYIVHLTAIQNGSGIKENDLIINSDGKFFKVVNVDGINITVSLLAVSGTGGGSGSGGGSKSDVILMPGLSSQLKSTLYIYGQTYNITLNPQAVTGYEGVINSNLSIICEIWKDSFGNDKIVKNIDMQLNEIKTFNLGSLLPEGNVNKIRFFASDGEGHISMNYESPAGVTIAIQKVTLRLDDSQMRNWNPITSDSFTAYYLIDGYNTKQYIQLYIDDLNNPYGTPVQVTGQSFETTIFCRGQLSHGTHQLIAILQDKTNEQNIISLEPIYFNFAYQAPNNKTPLLWFEKEKYSCYQNDNILIRYNVMDITDGTDPFLKTSVSLYINNIFIRNAEPFIFPTADEERQWSTWPINNLQNYKNQTLELKIVCRNAIATVNLEVLDDGIDFILQGPQPVLEFSPDNRSNNEPVLSRNTYSYHDFGTIEQQQNLLFANFKNFNWTTNGWLFTNNRSVLRITDGSSVSFPYNHKLVYNKIATVSDSSAVENFTFDFIFKVKNVTDYTPLIKNLVYYQLRREGVPDIECLDGSQELQEALDQGYEYILDKNGYEVIRIEKELVPNRKPFCKLHSPGTGGFEISAEQAFFTTGKENQADNVTVSIDYNSNELIHLTFVLGPQILKNDTTDRTSRTLSVYLNGVLSGIFSVKNPFNITATDIEVNSDSCDVDLYSIKIYHNNLTMFQIMNNYLVDIKDIEGYKINDIFKDVKNVSQPFINGYNTIDYDTLVRYNNNADLSHKTMPYAVIEVSDNKIYADNLKTENSETEIRENVKGQIDDRLPVYKGNSRKVNVEFINPYLDGLLENGEITDSEAKFLFPSFSSTNAKIDVQGTSSQGYPRRNYKIKFKDAKNITFKYPYTDEEGNKQVKTVVKTSDKYFYIDNVTDSMRDSAGAANIHTDVFTWKIDYMDSSSAHNTGLANLMQICYNKHPLDYYSNSSNNISKYRTSIYGFPFLLFHKHASINGSQQEIEFIGKYNFNLDKSSNEYYGFTDSSLSLQKDTKDNRLKYKNMAECWEIRNNQGSWPSFNPPNPQPGKVEAIDNTDDNGMLEILNYFEPRYLYKATEKTVNDKTEYYGYDGTKYYDQEKIADFIEYAGLLSAGKQDDDDGNGAKLLDTVRSKADINTSLKGAYKNLWKLIKWIDSTNVNKANPDTQIDKVTYIIDEDWMALNLYPRYTNEQLKNENKIRDSYDETLTYYKYNESTHKMIKQDPESVQLAFNNYNYNTGEGELNFLVIPYDDQKSNSIIQYAIEYDFENDSELYRKIKFKAEFDKHLNKEYCLVYYIMTETLLMFDSRGKNMMLASWGPIEENGDYIWFPIFYDLDTQLGLNNTGIPTYSYSTDATDQKAFSTPDSILWNNFARSFSLEIKNKYKELRKEGNILSMSVLQDGYNYAYDLNYHKDTNNPRTNSVVLQGLRPFCIHNADEYYKYIAPVTVGYRTTNISKGAVTDSGNYYYACQGTRDSYRRTLLRDRLNYLDSYWRAGKYDLSQHTNGLWMRINANADRISDPPYSDKGSSNYAILNANPNFIFTGYHSQYFSVGYDQIFTVINDKTKYSTTPIEIKAFDNYAKSFEEDNGKEEQLIYIIGGDSIKSIGDLSLKYLSELHINTATSLQELILGNDNKDYYNQRFDISRLNFSTVAESKGFLLLKDFNICGFTNYEANIDFANVPKLETFKALRTKISGVTISQGAPLNTIYLPQTVNSITFDQLFNLTNIIKKDPYNDITKKYEGKGFYLEGLFNPEYVSQNSENQLTSLVLKQCNLGISSYDIFNQIVNYNNADTRIELEKVEWTPYRKIDLDEEFDINKTYYTLTDVHTYNVFNTNNSNEWQEQKQSGNLYIKEFYSLIKSDSEENYNSSIPYFIFDGIRNYSLFNGTENDWLHQKSLDRLYKDNLINYPIVNINTINTCYTGRSVSDSQIIKFTDTNISSGNIYGKPILTGNIHIENSESNPISGKKINELESYFKGLSITANYVDQGFIVRYNYNNQSIPRSFDIEDGGVVQINQDNDLKPIENHFTFLYWTAIKPSDEVEFWIIDDYEISNQPSAFFDNNGSHIHTIQDDIKEIVLYPVYERETYTINFYIDESKKEEGLIETQQIKYQGVIKPTLIPYKKHDLYYKRYKFNGYYDFKDNEKKLILLSTFNQNKITANSNIDFISKFTEEDCREADADLDLITTTVEGRSSNRYIRITGLQYDAQGPIVLPTYVNDLPVKWIGDNAFKGKKITAIFWKKEESSNQIPLTNLGVSCFENSSLEYFTFGDNYLEISSSAFKDTPFAKTCTEVKASTIGDMVLTAEEDESSRTIILLGTQSIGNFITNTNIKIQLGTESEGACQISSLGKINPSMRPLITKVYYDLKSSAVENFWIDSNNWSEDLPNLKTDSVAGGTY